MLTSFLLATALLGQPDFVPTAQQPVGWRGDGSGRFPAATPATDWDLGTGKNVMWKTKLPFFSASSPIVVGDRVFTTAEPDLLICLEAKTGKELWRRHGAIFLEKLPAAERDQVYAKAEKLLAIAEQWLPHKVGDAHSVLPWRRGAKEAGEEYVTKWCAERNIDLAATRALYQEIGVTAERDRKRSGKPLLGNAWWFWFGNTAPTPASDGRFVVAKLGGQKMGWNYLVCYDLDGNRQWAVEIGQTGCWNDAKFDSPLIIDGKVISQFSAPTPGAAGKRDSSERLAAFDLATGKMLWAAALTKFRKRLTTASPVRMTVGGVPVIQFNGVMFHPEDGRVLCNMQETLACDVDTPCPEGDLLASGGSKGNTTGSSPTVMRLRWQTPGQELAAEQVYQWAGARSKDGTGWLRGSVLLHDGFLYKQAGHPAPRIWSIEMANGKYRSFSPADTIRSNNPKRKPDAKNGCPDEDDSSAALGGKYVYGCPSAWPSQFAVISTGADAKLISAPVLTDDCMVASPWFQGNRLYLRGYRYLYCIGEK